MADRQPPRIENAPGLSWRPLKTGWIALWRARNDLVARGYRPKNVRLWISSEEYLEPGPDHIIWIQDQCQANQSAMLHWGRGGTPVIGGFNNTLRSLIWCYQNDKDSPYRRKVRYQTRIHYDKLCRRLERDCGDTMIADIKARSVLRLHEGWVEGGHVARGHALIAMLRTLVNFGSAYLEDAECARLAGVLGNMTFPQAKPRTERLTAEQAIALRSAARAQGKLSIALAQAFQFDLMLRQKDVIGEWVPLAEPGMSDVVDGHRKWIRGLRWEEIDANWTLRHTTSKRQKDIEVNLTLAPMVMEELGTDRSKHPASGPVIVSEFMLHPWGAQDFQRAWRKLARECGIPDSVRSMDSRAGAITEATEAGADLESIKHAATHSDIAMTQRYARGATEKTAQVMQLRAAHRNKGGTK